MPAAGRRPALGALVAFHRLRPWRTRLARLAAAGAVAAGLAGSVGRRRLVDAPGAGPLLLDHLADVLGEPTLLFAGSARACREFVTPVLQLLRPDGRTVGFAKLGWDAVTDGMVIAERAALDLLASRPIPDLTVPAVRWSGRWAGHEVLVTEPLPRGVRRLRGAATVPLSPLGALAEIDGAGAPGPIAASTYWHAARATASIARRHGDATLEARLDALEPQFGEVELRFGRWHGDWVPWNLGRCGRAIAAWDWAYSAPAVPLGFDALHFSFLPLRVGASMAPDLAAARAADTAAPALRELGLDDEAREATVALHRLEVDLREARAGQARAGWATEVAGS